jgi:hypothetical protein
MFKGQSPESIGHSDCPLVHRLTICVGFKLINTVHPYPHNEWTLSMERPSSLNIPLVVQYHDSSLVHQTYPFKADPGTWVPELVWNKQRTIQIPHFHYFKKKKKEPRIDEIRLGVAQSLSMFEEGVAFRVLGETVTDWPKVVPEHLDRVQVQLQ